LFQTARSYDRDVAIAVLEQPSPRGLRR
jgi:hypothetical protein